MKTKELNATELQEVNGGSSTSSNDSGILGSIGIGNIGTFGTASKNGDQSSASAFSVGSGINSSIGEMLSEAQRSL